MKDTILVTGGAGFIGSNFVQHWLSHETGALVNLDKLTYAGNTRNLIAVAENARYQFVHADIADAGTVSHLLRHEDIRAVVHFAAESHVDRSITGPGEFVQTNVNGTFSLL